MFVLTLYIIYICLLKFDLNSNKYSKVEILFLGDSQIQKGINPELFPNSKNMAVSGESLLFTFYKIKHILNHENKIRIIYLGIGVHSFSDFYDEVTLGQIKNLDNTSEYFPYLPYWLQKKLILEHKMDLPKYYSRIYNSLILNSFNLNRNSYNFGGGYFNNDSIAFNLSRSKSRACKAYFNVGRVREFSTYNLNSLDSIIDLCHKKRIKIQVIRMPVFNQYFNLIPKKFIEFYDFNLKKRNISYIKFDDTLNSNIFLPDGDHLNIIGSNIISKKLYNKVWINK